MEAMIEELHRALPRYIYDKVVIYPCKNEGMMSRVTTGYELSPEDVKLIKDNYDLAIKYFAVKQYHFGKDKDHDSTAATNS